MFVPYGLVKAAVHFSEREERFFGDFAGKRKGELYHVSLRHDSDRRPAFTQLAAKVGDEEAQTPFELLRDKNLRDQVCELLEVLDDRERKIIFQRFGLGGGNPKTLEVVGKQFGVTRERIRQLQNVALDKLRRALRKKETQQAVPVVAT